jgi:hypothetical protein
MVIGATATSSTTNQENSVLQNAGSQTTSDFLQQLESAIENALTTAGMSNEFNVQVQDTASQTAANPQYTIALTANPESSATTASPANTASSENPTVSGGDSTMTPTDAYWAAQPAAVQALRYAPDDEKAAMAEQLATEGYAIDVPIMVWGSDPLATMIQRQEEGYTWVPSALQSSVQDAPGVSMPGVTPYNPDDPPAGSIAVSTAFANGTDIAADPIAEEWLQGQASSASSTTSLTS